MAEPVYKKITELDVLSGAIDGSETLPIVKSGKTYRRTLANLFGTGWITSLLGAFTAFKAPDADHADDADTVCGEDTTALHNAALLTGNINLDRIPAELTGKNAATATLAAVSSAAVVAQVSDNVAYPIALLESAGAGSKAIKSDSSGGTYNPSTNTAEINISGNAATATYASNAKVYNGSIHSTSTSENYIYGSIGGFIPNIYDSIIITGVIINPGVGIYVINRAQRLSSSSIRLYGACIDSPALYIFNVNNGGGGDYTVSLSW